MIKFYFSGTQQVKKDLKPSLVLIIEEQMEFL